MARSIIEETTLDRTSDGCRCPGANERYVKPSLLSWGSLKNNLRQISRMTGATPNICLSSLAVVCLLAGCGPEPSATKTEPAEAAKPIAPAVPEEIQSAAQSLLGKWGESARKQAEEWLDKEIVHFFASDAHNTHHRPLRLREAYAVVEARWGEQMAQSLFRENPLAAFEGRDLPYEPQIPSAPDLTAIYFWANGIDWNTTNKAQLDACPVGSRVRLTWEVPDANEGPHIKKIEPLKTPAKDD